MASYFDIILQIMALGAAIDGCVDSGHGRMLDALGHGVFAGMIFYLSLNLEAFDDWDD